MSTSSSSDASIIESNNLSTNESSSGKHILEDYGALFMPYQHEHLMMRKQEPRKKMTSLWTKMVLDPLKYDIVLKGIFLQKNGKK